jgi:hypothetical protein
MIVALDLERDRFAVAEVDDARVLAGALEDARRFGREAPQEERRVLVAAVLRPEEREDGELEVVRLALEQLLDTVIFPVGQSEGAVERLFGDPRQGFESSDGPGWEPSPADVSRRTQPPPERNRIRERRTCLSRLRAGSATP